MKICKSKSHPDLLVYASPRFVKAKQDPFSFATTTAHTNFTDGDSISSNEDAYQCCDDDMKQQNHDKQLQSTQHEHSTIGTFLWKLILTKKLRIHDSTNTKTDIDWKTLKQTYPNELSGSSSSSSTSVKQLQQYYQALTSIIVLDETIDPRATTFLEMYNGRLIPVNSTLTKELRHNSPTHFAALVADFNDNLAYQLERNSQRGMPAVAKTMSSSKWIQELQNLEDSLKAVLAQTNSAAKTDVPLGIQGSFLRTEYKTIAQPAHVDFTWKMLEEEGDHLWLAFFALTQEGMILQVWPTASDTNKTTTQGQLVFVPLGKMLIMPSDIIHGGGFRTRPIFGDTASEMGNLRYHLYLSTDGHGLPQFVKSTYTLKNDRGRELADVYVNAPGLEEGETTTVYDGESSWKSSSILMDLLLD